MQVTDLATPATAGPLSAFRRPDGVRWRIPLTLMVTLFVAYLDRMNVSLAVPLMARDFGWSVEDTKRYGGDLLTLFYIGHGLTNIFLSPFAARFGPRKSLLVIVVLWSVFTALGAVLSASLTALMATRVLLGVSEGVHFPMMSMLTKAWFPPNERGRANSTWISGLLLGICLSPVLLIPLMNAFGWRIGFLVLAAFGLLISLPLVLRFVRDTPKDDPAVSAAERDYIAAGTALEPTEDDPGVRAILRAAVQPSMLLMILIGMLNNVVALGIALWLPTYFVITKGLPYENLIYATSLPYILGVVGVMFWGSLGDRLNARAWLGALGLTGAGFAVWYALQAPDVVGSIVGFSVGVFFISAFPACEIALVQRVVAREVTGPATGIYNGMTTLIGGGAGPLVISAIIGGGADGNPDGVMAAVGTCFLTAVLLVVLGWRLRY